MLTFAKNIINILGIVDDNIDKIDATSPWGTPGNKSFTPIDQSI